MSNDVFLVLGIILGFLSFPSFVGAFAESRVPRTAITLIVFGGGMIAYAVIQKPSGYALEEVPAIFLQVFSDLFP